MNFYRQIFTNLENNTQSKNRESSLTRHIQRHFPILFQRYPDSITQYINGSLLYSDLFPIFTSIKSERILQIDTGTVRSRNHIFGLPDPVMDELRRFQEAFGPRGILGSNRVPGTGIIQNSTRDHIRTFLW